MSFLIASLFKPWNFSDPVVVDKWMFKWMFNIIKNFDWNLTEFFWNLLTRFACARTSETHIYKNLDCSNSKRNAASRQSRIPRNAPLIQRLIIAFI